MAGGRGLLSRHIRVEPYHAQDLQDGLDRVEFEAEAASGNKDARITRKLRNAGELQVRERRRVGCKLRQLAAQVA